MVREKASRKKACTGISKLFNKSMKAYTCLEHSSCLFIELSKVDANFLETDTVVHDRTRTSDMFRRVFKDVGDTERSSNFFLQIKFLISKLSLIKYVESLKQCYRILGKACIIWCLLFTS